MFLHADSEDSDQTGRMSRLICVFTGRRGHFVCLVVPPAAHIKASHAVKRSSVNSVSSQCACGKKSVARKSGVDPKILKWYFFFEKCNPEDFKFFYRKIL